VCTFQKKKRGRRVPLFCHIIFIIIINDVDRVVVVVECKKMRAWVWGTLEEKDDDVYDEKKKVFWQQRAKKVVIAKGPPKLCSRPCRDDGGIGRGGGFVIGRLRRPSAILLGRRSANAVHRGNKPTHR
jgi:hypothetical protein